MGELSLRDRFFTPQVARATVSPVGVGAAIVAGAAAGVAVEWWAALPVAAAVWAGRVLLAIPQKRRSARIDPFTVGEPWRRFVQAALKSRARAEQAATSARRGPLQQRLADVTGRIDVAVEEVWSIARRGHELSQARRDLDPGRVRHRLSSTSDGDPSRPALQAQLASVERLERVIDDAETNLRLLQARLDEAAARTVELAVRADEGALGVLGADIEGVVTEMEALRLALEETDGGSASPGIA